MLIPIDLHAEPLRGCRTHQGRVVPCQLGDRLGELLEPAIVCEAAVENSWVRLEKDFEFAGSRGLLRALPLLRPGPESDRLRVKSRVDNDAIVDRRLPEVLEVSRPSLLFPVAPPEPANQLVVRRSQSMSQKRKDLVSRTPVVERFDKGLHNAGCPIECAGVAPGLQIMGLREMPLAQPGGLVLVHAQMHPNSRFLHVLGEIEISRRREYRIALQNHEHFHLAAIQCLDQVLKGCRLVHGTALDGLGVDQRLADIRQVIVHGMRQRVDGRRLPIACQDNGAAPVAYKVFRDRMDPAGMLPPAALDGFL